MKNIIKEHAHINSMLKYPNKCAFELANQTGQSISLLISKE